MKNTVGFNGGASPGFYYGHEHVAPLDRDEILRQNLAMPIEELEGYLNQTDMPQEDYAIFAAVAVLRAEIEPNGRGRAFFKNNAAKMREVLVRGRREGGLLGPKSSYLFNIAMPAVSGGQPDLAELILVSRSAQDTSPFRLYKPGAFADYARHSTNDIDDTVVEMMGSDRQFSALQDATRKYVSMHHADMTDTTGTVDGRTAVVPLTFNANTAANQVLVQLDIVKRLGFGSELDVTSSNVTRDAQLRLLIKLAKTAQLRSQGGERFGELPVWEFEAAQEFLDDREQFVRGNTVVANIPSRKWKFLMSTQGGSYLYERHLRQREQNIPVLNANYAAHFERDARELDGFLAIALDNNDVENAANVWAVITQRRNESPEMWNLTQKYHRRAALLLEPDLKSCASRMGHSWRLPRYVYRLVTDNFLALNDKYQALDGPYPSLFTEGYGSAADDFEVISSALGRWTSDRIGNVNPVTYKDLIGLTAAYKLYQADYNRYRLSIRGRRYNVSPNPAFASLHRLRCIGHVADLSRVRGIHMNTSIKGFMDQVLSRPIPPGTLPGYFDGYDWTDWYNVDDDEKH